MGNRWGVSPVVIVTRRRQPAGSSVMVGKTAMSSRVTWPATTGCWDAWVRGWTGRSSVPPGAVQVRPVSRARWEPARAPDERGTLSPPGETASIVAASSVSAVVDVRYTVASTGPPTICGESNGAVV